MSSPLWPFSSRNYNGPADGYPGSPRPSGMSGRLSPSYDDMRPRKTPGFVPNLVSKPVPGTLRTMMLDQQPEETTYADIVQKIGNDAQKQCFYKVIALSAEIFNQLNAVREGKVYDGTQLKNCVNDALWTFISNAEWNEESYDYIKACFEHAYMRLNEFCTELKKPTQDRFHGNHENPGAKYDNEQSFTWWSLPEYQLLSYRAFRSTQKEYASTEEARFGFLHSRFREKNPSKRILPKTLCQPDRKHQSVRGANHIWFTRLEYSHLKIYFAEVPTKEQEHAFEEVILHLNNMYGHLASKSTVHRPRYQAGTRPKYEEARKELAVALRIIINFGNWNENLYGFIQKSVNAACKTMEGFDSFGCKGPAVDWRYSLNGWHLFKEYRFSNYKMSFGRYSFLWG